MIKKNLTVCLLALLLMPVLLFFSCEEAPLTLGVPEDMTDYEFDSGETPVTVSDLPTFQGTAINQAGLNEMADPASTMSSSMRTVLNTVLSSLEPDAADRAASAYYSVMVTLEDESLTVEGLTIDYNKAAASFSVAGSWDGDMNDFVDISTMPQDLFDAIGAVNGSLLLNLDFDIEASTNSMEWTGPPIKSAIWHHTNFLSIENENVELDYDDITGAVSVSGTTTIKAIFNSSLGFTISNDSNGWNGKFIVEVAMEEIDEEDIPLADLQDAMDPEIEEGDADGLYDVISEYFFNGADPFLTITITAYDNNNEEIAQAEFDPFSFMPN